MHHDTDRHDDSARGAPGTSRRAFILAGGAAVIGATVLRGDLTAVNGGLAAMASAGGPRLSIGYVEGSTGATSLDEALAAGARRVVPASSLQSGGIDNRAATLTVNGFGPGVPADDSAPFDAVFVDAHISAPDRHASAPTLPFYAFTFRRSPAMVSGKSRFVIGASRGLRIGLHVTTSRAATASSATAVFTSGNNRSLPKLQRGVYLVGLGSTAWDAPRSLPALDDPAWSALASMVVSVDDV